MARQKATIPLRASQPLHSQGHLSPRERNVRGRIEETRRREACFHQLRLLTHQPEVQFLEEDGSSGQLEIPPFPPPAWSCHCSEEGAEATNPSSTQVNK